MNIITTPGLLTTSAQDFNRCSQLRQHGYEWIAFQLQNGASTFAHDLAGAKSAGLYAGGWGVTYRASNFYADAKALAEQTLRQGGTHLTMDVEEAAKNTGDARGLKPIIDGCRAGGWTGPVNLNTLGPPINPQANDYAMDIRSFLDTGGGVQTQCYANAYDTYAPELGVQYWTRVGVPRDRLNIQISLFPAESDAQHPGRRFDGATWTQLLKAASVTREFSIFMAEAATDADLSGLDPLSIRAPLVTSPITENRAAALGYLQASIAYWRNTGTISEATLQQQRQTLAWRVLNMPQTRTAQESVRNLLDNLGAPRP